MPQDPLSQQFMRSVPRANRVVCQELRRGFAGIFTVPQQRILVRLEDGPLSNKDLAESQGVSVAAMSRAVAQLARKGLVQRHDDAHDRRLVLLSLSPKGRTHLAEHSKRMQALFVQRVASLSADDREALSRGLGLLEQIFPLPLHPKDKHARH
jgi:DNA-binding MarR family transcriptional regulator